MGDGPYSTARNNNHCRSNNIILIQIPSHVEITVLRIVVAKQPRLPRRLKALRERQVVVAVPAPKCGDMAPPPVKFLHKECRVMNSFLGEKTESSENKGVTIFSHPLVE
ncbi:UNVERIFIED_CONTAM: hypothetical protein Sangu_0414900 [Sesamum angustifolium]|uniref:Uncharacterized protein n=1 Tax=Sesamum angustifolium TaxID=2727405 RepID=A0AAW2QTF4_9LAMI